MKRLFFLVPLAMAFAIVSCSTTPPSNNNLTTSTSGNWEARLTGGTGQESLLDFVVTFSVTDTSTTQPNEPLDITALSFYNQGACFALGDDEESETGTVTLNTASTGQVTGTMNLNIGSASNGTLLQLNGNVTGTSNSTTTTTGTLSDGVVSGTWTLTPGATATGCSAATGDFLMCQGAATCTVP
jgi:hypothetical protein